MVKQPALKVCSIALLPGWATQWLLWPLMTSRIGPSVFFSPDLYIHIWRANCSLFIFIYIYIQFPISLSLLHWQAPPGKSYIKLNILKSRNHHVILPYYPILLLINKPDSLPFYFSLTCRYYSRLLFKYIKVA